MFKGAREQLAEPRAQDLDNEHRLPVRQGETAAIAVEHDDAGKDLDHGQKD